MSDNDGWVAIVALIFLLVAVVGGLAFDNGKDYAHAQFRDCRHLLATADSATVLRTKPECEKWTLPVREEKGR